MRLAGLAWRTPHPPMHTPHIPHTYPPHIPHTKVWGLHRMPHMAWRPQWEDDWVWLVSQRTQRGNGGRGGAAHGRVALGRRGRGRRVAGRRGGAAATRPSHGGRRRARGRRRLGGRRATTGRGPSPAGPSVRGVMRGVHRYLGTPHFHPRCTETGNQLRNRKPRNTPTGINVLPWYGKVFRRQANL